MINTTWADLFAVSIMFALELEKLEWTHSTQDNKQCTPWWWPCGDGLRLNFWCTSLSLSPRHCHTKSFPISSVSLENNQKLFRHKLPCSSLSKLQLFVVAVAAVRVVAFVAAAVVVCCCCIHSPLRHPTDFLRHPRVSLALSLPKWQCNKVRLISCSHLTERKWRQREKSIEMVQRERTNF